MPATPARRAFITQSHRRVIAGPDSGVATKYGDRARDTADTPVETHWDSLADAQVFVTARLTLLKRDARRLSIETVSYGTVDGAELGVALLLGSRPVTSRVTDAERVIDRDMITVGVGVDLTGGRTQPQVWG